MKREISVSYGRTVNTGNFNSIKISVGTSREVGQSEDVDIAIAEEFDTIREIAEEFIEGELKTK